MRPKAQDDTLINMVKQRQNSINQWCNQAVNRVSEQTRRAEHNARINNQILVKIPHREHSL